MSVERYSIEQDASENAEFDPLRGDWVLYSDYAALEAKCKALEGALGAALDIASTHGEAKNEAVRRLRQQQAALRSQETGEGKS